MKTPMLPERTQYTLTLDRRKVTVETRHDGNHSLTFTAEVRPIDFDQLHALTEGMSESAREIALNLISNAIAQANMFQALDEAKVR